MHTAELPEHREHHDAQGPCLADDVTALDNSAFAARVRTAAAVLRDRGVRAGDVIAVMLPNRLELVIALFAAWRLRASVTPVNPALTDAEAAFQIGDSGAKVVIGTPGSGLVTLDVEELAGPHSKAEAVAEAAEAAFADSDLALLIYTSGTTGRPKGVMLDHGNLRAMAEMLVAGLTLGPADHSLLILPLFHVNGILVSILAPLFAGGQATIAGRFKPNTLPGTIERVRPTYFSGVPAIYAMLTGLEEGVLGDMSSLRFVICGAAPMPAELIARFEERYRVPVIEGYGLSEGTCATTLNPPNGVRKPGTVGLPLPGQQVALMDPEGHLISPGPGEVVVKGPNVMRGYLNRPADNAETIVAGWLHTGDVGRFDDDGYLILVDRIKDMIIRGGENLYPKEIENAFHSHPEVLEAAVVGAPDPVMGEVPIAFITLYPHSTATPEDLQAHCAERLAKIKIPTVITILEALPKNPVGKIDKPRLRRGLAVS